MAARSAGVNHKDATYSTGCTKEMKCGADTKALPEMQLMGPPYEKFQRRKDQASASCMIAVCRLGSEV